jgi:hypothetical protein
LDDDQAGGWDDENKNDLIALEEDDEWGKDLKFANEVLVVRKS